MSRNTRRDVGSSSIGTLLSGYSSFGGGMAPLNMGHPAVAKITLAPGILNLLISLDKGLFQDIIQAKRVHQNHQKSLTSQSSLTWGNKSFYRCSYTKELWVRSPLDIPCSALWHMLLRFIKRFYNKTVWFYTQSWRSKYFHLFFLSRTLNSN